MSYTIALAGNPNSGKTTLFNEMTGSTQYVGNWPGVTVEKKEGRLKKIKDEIKVIDLPGIYSMSPYSLEEIITRNYIIEKEPDIIINIIDASNIERNLYLTTQLLELGRPVIAVLNMIDVVKKRRDIIDIKKMHQELGVPVIEASASKGEGIDKIIETVLEKKKENNINLFSGTKKIFDNKIEDSIAKIVESFDLNAKESIYNKRWLAVKLLEGDQKIFEKIYISSETKKIVEECIRNIEDCFNDDMESIIADQRYKYISKIIKKTVKKTNAGNLSVSDRIDKIITNRILAIPIFFLIMWLIYWVSISTLGDYTIGWVEWLIGDVIGSAAEQFLIMLNASDWIIGLVVDGIIGGVGSVLVFVPQIMLLFFFISLLEDCGYMARVAFIMDRIFRKFGLSGKSFIPMIIGTGCSVPGIMATRTIENERDRKLTVILTPFIPCGAKLPVFAMFIAAFFTDKTWVGPSMYIIGIAVAVLSGILLKNTILKGEATPFVMELPEYKMPRFKGVLIHMWERGKAFIIKAGTIIFIASSLIWLLQTFDFSFNMVEADNSMLAHIGRAIAPLFIPLGFGEWRAAVATVTGLLAKEVVVATFGILEGIGETAVDDPALLDAVGQIFNRLSGYSFMIFTLLAAPCFAAIGAMKREFNSLKWTLIAVGYQTGIAYVLAMIIYQAGRLF